MRRAIVFLICLSLLSAGAVFAAERWPGFRGPGHDGRVTDARLFDGGAAGLTLGWKRSLGSGYSALAVGDGRVLAMFAQGDGDFLAAFDTKSGDELWRYRVSDTYAGHDGSHDGPISTPLLDGGRVYGLGARGHLFAVDAADGKPLWTTHLADDHGAAEPWYGFSTSPLIADGVLVVLFGAKQPAAEEGAEEEGAEKEEQPQVPGIAVAGFDPANGKLLWTLGDDTIEYQSPIVADMGGRRQVIAAGKDNLYGLDARSGKILWSYEHAGDARAMGGLTIVPLPAGDDRLFLMNKIDSSVMLQIEKNGNDYEVAELWSTGALKMSYVTPVYHEGHIYGMSNRIFVCLDAATGDVKWRSREPGDGFPTLIGDHLVMITKPGSLHVAQASPDGYKEVAKLDLFDEHSWSEVAYADGHLYARSMGHLARIDPGTDVAASAETSWVRETAFGRFLAQLDRATDKSAAIDAFLERQTSLPIVEDTGAVHFVYRGDATDVGIVGDMIGYRREDPMVRVAGTDLFHYSTRLEPDAAVTYGFIVDFADPVADPLNPDPGKGLFGEVSWFAMPAWERPAYLDEARASSNGRTEDFEWKSVALEDEQRTAQIYLPAGYDTDTQRRYPVAYVHHGREALDEGRMQDALDHLIGDAVEPLIAVFVIADAENPRGDMRKEGYTKMLIEELVPAIDKRYRTIADPLARASVGSGRAANVALLGAFKHPEVFGRVGAQATMLGPDGLGETLRNADEQPMVIYLDWGTYHMRSPHEAWDLAVETRKLWAALREAGYRPAGGELPEGYSWSCWRGHTDELLTALFPRRRTGRTGG